MLDQLENRVHVPLGSTDRLSTTANAAQPQSQNHLCVCRRISTVPQGAPLPRPIAWGRGEFKSRCLARVRARSHRIRAQIKCAYARAFGRSANAFPAFPTKNQM